MSGVVDGEQAWNEIVRDSPVGGKGLFAWKDVAAGEGINTIMRPLVLVLDTRRLADTCSNCLEWSSQVFLRSIVDEYEPPSLKACLGCKTMRYCSKKCQAESWKREHKHECKLLGKLQEKGALPNAARAVLRMLQIAAGPFGRELRQMKSHLNTITKNGGQRAENLLVLSTGIHEYSGTPFGIEFVQEMFALVLTNSLTHYTSTYDPLGIAVDPLAAKANHSCEPNCVVVCDGASLHFRTIKSIKKGEEIFISYIDPSQPFNRRQHELQDKFYFQCKCTKCALQFEAATDKFIQQPDAHGDYLASAIHVLAREDIAMPVLNAWTKGSTARNDPDHLENAHRKMNDLIAIQKTGYMNYEAAIAKGELEHMALLTSGLKACLDTGIWPESRQPVPIIRHNALCNYLIISSRFPNAYTLAFLQGLKIYFDCWPVVHPQPFHPMRVVLTWTLAQLALVIAGEPRNAAAQKLIDRGLDCGIVIWGLLLEVQDNVQKSHGKGHSFAATVKRKVDEVRTDMTRSDPSRIRWAETRIPDQWKVLRKLANDSRVNSFNQFKKETDKDIEKMTDEDIERLVKQTGSMEL